MSLKIKVPENDDSMESSLFLNKQYTDRGGHYERPDLASVATTPKMYETARQFSAM